MLLTAWTGIEARDGREKYADRLRGSTLDASCLLDRRWKQQARAEHETDDDGRTGPIPLFYDKTRQQYR